MLRISFCLYFFITNFRIMANTLSLEYFVGIWLCWFFWCKFTMLKVIFMKKQVEQKSFEGKGQRLKAGIWGHNIEISWRKVFFWCKFTMLKVIIMILKMVHVFGICFCVLVTKFTIIIILVWDSMMNIASMFLKMVSCTGVCFGSPVTKCTMTKKAFLKIKIELIPCLRELMI